MVCQEEVWKAKVSGERKKDGTTGREEGDKIEQKLSFQVALYM